MAPEARAVYEALRAKGESMRWALMVASRQAPGTSNTDRNFLCDRHDNQHHRGANALYQRAAKRAGINTTGKIFMSSLGKASDPRAWVSGLDDVKAACKAKGKTCERLGVYQPEKPPEPEVPLAEPIVRRRVKERLAADPALKERCKKNGKVLQEVREAVIDKHAPWWKKGKKSDIVVG